MSKAFIMNILYSNQEPRVIDLQCKENFSKKINSALPKDICKRKIGKKCGAK